MKIKLKRSANMEKNLIFPLAVVRYLIKMLLGWISLFTISGNYRRLAIHDMMVDS